MREHTTIEEEIRLYTYFKYISYISKRCQFYYPTSSQHQNSFRQMEAKSLCQRMCFPVVFNGSSLFGIDWSQSKMYWEPIIGVLSIDRLFIIWLNFSSIPDVTIRHTMKTWNHTVCCLLWIYATLSPLFFKTELVPWSSCQLSPFVPIWVAGWDPYLRILERKGWIGLIRNSLQIKQGMGVTF